nr:MAG TPA: calcium binding protein [Microviridae sp.]
METNVTLGEEIAKIIKTEVDRRYNHHVILGIPLDLDLGKLNEKGGKKER